MKGDSCVVKPQQFCQEASGCEDCQVKNEYEETKERQSYKNMNFTCHANNSRLFTGELMVYPDGVSEWHFNIFDGNKHKHAWRGNLEQLIEKLLEK